MKKILLSFFALVLSFGLFAQASDLFISEYVEGTGFSKAIEIFNGTGAPVDLSIYSLEKDVNGAGVFGSTLALTGTLADNDVFVVAHSSADAAVLAVTDIADNGTVTNFNGNDQIRLLKNGAEIDRIGVSGGADFAKDVTYVRNAAVSSPSSGEQNPATNGEWDPYAVNTFTYLGAHTFNGGGVNTAAEITAFSFSQSVGTATINSGGATVDVDVMPGTTVTSLTPTITLSYGATVSPASGVAQDFTSPVTYTVTAEDGTTIKAWTVTVTVTSLTAIYDIQYTTDPSGNSPLIGQTVVTNGIVTAVGNTGFWIQDGTGMWNGVFVYNNTINPTLGDDITLTALVDEYNNVTELKNVSSSSINSSANALPAVSVINTADMAEAYEGVLVSVLDAECLSLPDANGLWNVNNGATLADTVNIDDMLYSFTPTVTTHYDITGVGDDYLGNHKIQPRNAGDIIVTGTAGTQAEIVAFAFTQQTGAATINSGAATIAIEVANGTSVTALVPTIQLSAGATVNPASGVAQDFTNPVTYTVTAQDGTTTKVWTVTVTVASGSGGTSIYNIQYTTDAGGLSTYDGQVVTTSGVVTSLHYNYEGGTYRGYFMQDGTGLWNGIYVYDNTNTPAVGDNITVTATVDEYKGASDTYSCTELTFVSSFVVNSQGNALPAAVDVETGDVAEAHEGILIHVDAAQCTATPDGFGVWAVNSNNTGVLSVDDDVFEYVTPALGTLYNISGVCHYSFNAYKILPREAGDITVGINEIESSIEVNFYPNPASDFVTVETEQTHGTIMISDLTGKAIVVTEINSATTTVDVSVLSSGIYLMQISDENGNLWTGKLLK